MKTSETETIRISIGGLFTTLLTIAFVVLKLCNVITWSWWWVLSPLWIPLALCLIIFFIILIISMIANE